MSDDTIVVDPAAFASAATTFGTGHDSAAGIINTLTKALDNNWGCAGTDTTGKSFASQYDPAAFNAVRSGTDIVNGLGQLHDLLQYTSVNHANANSQSAIGANPADHAQPPALTPHYDQPKFEGAYGGDSHAPFGWSLITRWLQGRVWPNGHQDKLDALNTAWDTAANGLEAFAKTLPAARQQLDYQISAEVPQILDQIDLVVGDINTAVTQFRNLGTACSDYADALTTAHNAIGKAVAELVAFAGFGALVGSLIGPEGTAGGAAVAAGTRGAATGAAIVVDIDTLVSAVGAVRGALAGAAIAAGPITANLGPLLQAKPTQFNSETGPSGSSPARPADKGPAMKVDGKQFGKKIGKHAQDYGLDPADPQARIWLRNHIADTRNSADEVRQGAWNPDGGGGSDYWFYRKGQDVIITKNDGSFVTILKDGSNNGWFQGAQPK